MALTDASLMPAIILVIISWQTGLDLAYHKRRVLGIVDKVQPEEGAVVPLSASLRLLISHNFPLLAERANYPLEGSACTLPLCYSSLTLYLILTRRWIKKQYHTPQPSNCFSSERGVELRSFSKLLRSATIFLFYTPFCLTLRYSVLYQSKQDYEW